MGYGQGLLMSIMRVFLYFMVIIFILFSLLFLYNVNLSNHYVSQCNEIITRSGGLTKTAYQKCNKLSETYYHNYYHVSINKDMQRNSSDYKQDDKGFDMSGQTKLDNNSYVQNYNNNEIPFGSDAHYYVYSDVPMYKSLNYHSDHFTKKPLRESVVSAIRAGSQN